MRGYRGGSVAGLTLRPFLRPVPEAPAVGLFLRLPMALHSGNLPTDCLQATKKKKPHYQIDSGVSFVLAERVGFEPTVVLPLRLISSQVHSTTLPPLLCVEAYDYSQIFRASARRCRPGRGAAPRVPPRCQTELRDPPPLRGERCSV